SGTPAKPTGGSAADQGVCPTVTAVVPARDESLSIAQAIDSLRSQTHRLQIVVVDDNSADGTADIAREHGAFVVDGRPLPTGWTGKMWAVSQGVEAALLDRPDYVLLTDADIAHAPENVAQLVDRAQAHNFDLVSLMVLLRTESLAERVLMPAFVF